ncbi:MAG: DUF4268 domain-containing protein [Gammaproteobacteria bacterium]|nr:DUF4268 domain-containing protein [Gammaproteobacteria bacterium]MYB37208.1 DUF4268 domain-containing protein [Gammaproteobacteria bacterium]
MTIGRIKRVGLREVWSHEAFDFTTWLEDNVDVLFEATGVQLTDVEREQPAGDFSVDLIASDEDGNAVVIENQLERSDHDHLGKLITYLVGLQARVGVWIVADPRPEHVAAVTWLNEGASADFYLLKLEAIRIGDSEPAPLLTRIVGPSETTREVGRAKQEMAEGERRYYRFFEGLLERAKARTQLHANVSPGKAHWVGAGAGISGLTFNYVARRHNAVVELYIDTPDSDANKHMLQTLFEKKEEVEDAFGGPLEWDSKDDRRSCRVRKTFARGGVRDEGDWDAIHDELAEGMGNLEKALRPHLKAL